ncbi:hypothetical protein ATM97_31610 [Nocardia sp. MH4]|uniref:hypothetical protein n=1 Tax=Nocardia TaxID=1817 RepID=UPI001C4E338E|nr:MULTISPECIES: hypothetical protein [Nocardia]MBW0273862.1 hypothetical protein [Nocardia sp. MH4]
MTSRLPFDSPLLAGCLLALVVGLPMAATAAATLRTDRYAADLAFAAGVLLVGWVTIQPLIIGRFHWLQPIFGVLGISVCVLALRFRHRPV